MLEKNTEKFIGLEKWTTLGFLISWKFKKEFLFYKILGKIIVEEMEGIGK
jgi:hypothetical protein